MTSQPTMGTPGAAEAGRSSEAMMEECRLAVERCNGVAGGWASFALGEREQFVALALTMRGQHAGHGIAGLTGSTSLSRERHMAHDLVNALGHADAPGTANPFAETPFEGMYRTAQRWKAHVEGMNARPGLQPLLNRRAVLIENLDQSAKGMHDAQRVEEETCVKMIQNRTEHGVAHQAAMKHLAIETDRFQEALTDLREFRQAPTTDPALRKVYQEMEALELVVSKTESGVRQARVAGLEPEVADQRDLRHAQIALKAFLQRHDATMPVNAETFVSRRNDDSLSQRDAPPRAR